MQPTSEQRRRGKRLAIIIWSGIGVAIIAGVVIYKLTRPKPPSTAQVEALAREALQMSEGAGHFELLAVKVEEVGECCQRYRIGLSPDEVEGLEARVSYRVRALESLQVLRISISGSDPYVWPRSVDEGKTYTGTVRLVLKREDGWRIGFVARY